MRTSKALKAVSKTAFKSARTARRNGVNPSYVTGHSFLVEILSMWDRLVGATGSRLLAFAAYRNFRRGSESWVAVHDRASHARSEQVSQ